MAIRWTINILYKNVYRGGKVRVETDTVVPSNNNNNNNFPSNRNKISRFPASSNSSKRRRDTTL